MTDRNVTMLTNYAGPRGTCGYGKDIVLGGAEADDLVERGYARESATVRQPERAIAADDEAAGPTPGGTVLSLSKTARELADKLEIDDEDLEGQGTGRNGMVVKGDVERIAKKLNAAAGA